MDNETYIPVNEHFHDELQMLALFQKNCEIKFINSGSISIIHTYINRLYYMEDGYYIDTTSGLNIRIDKLVSVNGVMANHFC